MKNKSTGIFILIQHMYQLVLGVFLISNDKLKNKTQTAVVVTKFDSEEISGDTGCKGHMRPLELAISWGWKVVESSLSDGSSPTYGQSMHAQAGLPDRLGFLGDFQQHICIAVHYPWSKDQHSGSDMNSAFQAANTAKPWHTQLKGEMSSGARTHPQH